MTTILIIGVSSGLGRGIAGAALTRDHRIKQLAVGAPDLVFDVRPISGVLPDLVRIADGDAARVLTVSNSWSLHR